MTKAILTLGFSVLVGSFVFYGEDLNDSRSIASQKDASSQKAVEDNK